MKICFDGHQTFFGARLSHVHACSHFQKVFQNSRNMILVEKATGIGRGSHTEGCSDFCWEGSQQFYICGKYFEKCFGDRLESPRQLGGAPRSIKGFV